MINYYFARDSEVPAALFTSAKEYMTWKCV